MRRLLLSLALTAAGAVNADSGIALNQLGYLPGASKVAAVPAGEATAFRVVEADAGRVVLRGRLGTTARWEPAGEDVRLADFSALKRPGHYRLQVDGQPDSPAFDIAGDVYAAVNAAALKAYYFNRASTSLPGMHASRWARPAGHADDRVLVHASAVSPGRPEGTVMSAP